MGRFLLLLAGIGLIFRSAQTMAFSIKAGVSGTLHDVMMPALEAVQKVWDYYGLGPPTITSIQDGVHMPGSLHPKGLAFDIRLNDVDPKLHETLTRAVRNLAGDEAFDVIHEFHGDSRDHLHVEFDPK